ncbi:MAG: anti-sigma factor antagonist [Solobacterium sp.]|nr:anti-sigma factor antagonist [Solobacterium sp.]
MQEVNGRFEDNKLLITLSGRIDSNNSHQAEAEIKQLIQDKTAVPIVIDAENLEYISSAGLRILLHLKKTNPDLKIINVKTDVYDILEMTGFTEMMTVEKAYRVISVEGCEEIGRGANGTIYRIDDDNIVKTFHDANALEEIRHEREVARAALVLGIPTAISYDVVKVGDSYGSVFELLNARSFSKILSDEPDKLDWCVHEYVELLKKIHGTVVTDGQFPDQRETAIKWAQFMQDYLPEETGRKLLKLVEDVPQDNHMIHGDYHTKNLQLQGDEVLLIDMDTLAIGHPIFELGSMYNAFVGFSELDHSVVQGFQGFDYETSTKFWHKVLAAYLGTKNEDRIREVEDKARIIGYTRLIRRSIRRDGLNDPERKKEIDHWTKELIELVSKTDTLLFAGNELEVDAKSENLPQVISFIEERMEEAGFTPKAITVVTLAAEEIFVNIASYAYEHGSGKGKAKIRVEITGDPVTAVVTFIDQGIPFDPMAKEDPDVSLPAEERTVGGLGIFMTKKLVDDMSYEYKDGENILKLVKKLS